MKNDRNLFAFKMLHQVKALVIVFQKEEKMQVIVYRSKTFNLDQRFFREKIVDKLDIF